MIPISIDVRYSHQKEYFLEPDVKYTCKVYSNPNYNRIRECTNTQERHIQKVFVVEDEGIIFEVNKGEILSISIFKKNENVDQTSYLQVNCSILINESLALLLFLFDIFVRRYSRTNKGSKKPPYNLKSPKESLTFQRSFQPFEFNLRKCMFIFEGGSKKQLRNGSFFLL